VVAVGGGHGLSPALQALRRLGTEPTAVVTVADDGGSTGRLRQDLGIIAPGDLRMALLTLARNTDLAELLAHRFTRGELEGHALGNLVLVALQEDAAGDTVAALDRAARLLDAAGRVLPSTLGPVHLCASVGGVQVRGQVRVATAKAPIQRIWLDPPDPPACREAVEAIADADVVILGPGSVFTSIIANLAVPGIRDALATTSARVIYVANLWQQRGEAAGLDLAAHVRGLLLHAPDTRLDAVVAHDGPVPSDVFPVVGELPEGMDVPLVTGDLVARHPDGEVAPAHDSERLAQVLEPLLSRPALTT
jgi:uncharacterized cofD-like protein